MKLRFNLQRGILLFSALLLILLLWLSISFLVVAKSSLHDATSQELHLTTDNALRNAMIAIADERAGFHWLTGIDGLFFTESSLNRYYTRTDEELTLSLQSIREALDTPEYSHLLLFERDELLGLIRDLKVQLASLSVVRKSIAQDLNLALAQRSSELNISSFDYFSELIEKLELIRNGAQYTSKSQNRDTRNHKELSDAIWKNITLNSTLSAYIEGYLTTSDLKAVDIKSRSAYIFRELQINFNKIDLIYSHSGLNEALDELIANYISWHKASYVNPVDRIIGNINQSKSAPYSNSQWRDISYQFDQYNQNILNQLSALNSIEIQKLKARANRNLTIDNILVVLCLLLMACTFWIVKLVHYKSTHDELTNIPNRHLFDAKGRETVESRFSKASNYCFLSIDLCNLRYINDHFGQPIGDQSLLKVISRLRNGLEKDALIGHVGAQEFSILLPLKNGISAKQSASNLSEAIAVELNIDGFELHLDSCIGHASFPDDAKNYEELRKAAHLAHYHAQQKGVGSFSAYSPSMSEAFQEHQRIQLDLARAIDNNELELNYQPQFDVEKQCVSGVEALIRWNHPELGLVSPFRFIPVAESAGLMPSIGQWVVEESARQSKAWSTEHGLDLQMSVNVSIHQFLVGDIVEIVASAISVNDLEPNLFEIEITESVAMADHELVKSKLDALRELGVHVALDDFGTGYSSLSYLQKLPFDTLKIDRSFINNLDGGTTEEKILVESIATMANRLNFHIVAEGVETERQVTEVQRLGIQTIQGYYYSKPIQGADIPLTVDTLNAKYRGDSSRAA
jgi:diguanylate cyclase (GGDEF)-like protein